MALASNSELFGDTSDSLSFQRSKEEKTERKEREREDLWFCQFLEIVTVAADADGRGAARLV
jgi:hypothetical protein